MVRAALVLAGLPLLAAAAQGLDGAPVWEQRWVAQAPAGGRPLAVRELADGSIFVLAAAGSELAGVRYNHVGTIVSTSILTVPHLNFFGLPNTQTRFAIDPFGGVFVAAVSDLEVTRGDIWVMKYDGFSGKPMWAGPRVLDTVPPTQDAPLQILVDSRGNAVVVGFSEGGSSDRIAVLIKYDGVTGANVWGPRTIHPATSITAALDPSDAVVLSLSARQGTGPNLIETYKFDGQSGSLLWGPARYGQHEWDVRMGALGVGLDGHVIVAAHTSLGILLFKYSGATGGTIWGPVSLPGPGLDTMRATGVVVSASGDVFVTGLRQGLAMALKYSGVDGRRLWGPVTEPGTVALPPAAALTPTDDLVVSSRSGTELVTTRYGADTGAIVWGPEPLAVTSANTDRSLLLVTSTGRILSVAETTDGTDVFLTAVERNPDTGQPAWGPTQDTVNASRRSSANDLTHDPAGNVIVIGGTTMGTIVTVKYNRTSGAVMWGPVIQAVAPGGGRLVGTDAAGDVFVVGWDGQLVLIKYGGTTGSVIWGPVHVADVVPRQLAITPSGDVFVAGELLGVLYGDVGLMKFSGSTGATLWGPLAIDGGPGRSDSVARIGSTAAGDVVVAATSIGSGITEAMTRKYGGATGALLWGPTVLPSARAVDLAIDGAGHVIVVGETRHNDPAMWTIKYDGATGNTVWGPRFAHGNGGYVDSANAVAIAANGDVFVTGTMYSDANDFDFATLKYSGATGHLLWGPVLFDGSGAHDDFARAIAVDASGNPVVAGESDNPALDSDLVLLKYDAATGAPLWSPQRIGGPDHDTLPFDNLSVVGSSAVIAGTVDDGFLTIAFDEAFRIQTLPEDVPPLHCGEAASIPLEARNPVGPVTWSVVSGALPGGLTLSPSTGVISGSPSAIGSFPFRARATDGVTVAERDFRIEVWDGAELLPILASADPLCPGQTADLSVAGSYGSYSWLPGGQSSSTISVSPAASTDYGVLLGTGLACRQRAYRRLDVGPLPLFVTAPFTVAPSSAGHHARVPDYGPGTTYAWAITNGSITGGAGTREIIFTASATGPLILQVTVTTAAGCSRTVSSTISIALVGFYTITPCRVFDTRWVPPAPAVPLAAGSTRVFPVSGQCGIPQGATAVAGNLTVTDPTGAGHMRIYPAGSPVPFTSSINYGAGQTRANNVLVGLGKNGDVAVDSGQLTGTAHVIFDVSGYFQ